MSRLAAVKWDVAFNIFEGIVRSIFEHNCCFCVCNLYTIRNVGVSGVMLRPCILCKGGDSDLSCFELEKFNFHRVPSIMKVIPGGGISGTFR